MNIRFYVNSTTGAFSELVDKTFFFSFQVKIMDDDTIYKILPVLLCALAIPVSMFFWIGNIAYSKLASDNQGIN